MMVCPRCGREGWYVHERRGGNVDVYFIHRDRRSKCYVYPLLRKRRRNVDFDGVLKFMLRAHDEGRYEDIESLVRKALSLLPDDVLRGVERFVRLMVDDEEFRRFARLWIDFEKGLRKAGEGRVEEAAPN